MSKPEIHNPFFFYRGLRFEAEIGSRNEFQHSFGAVGGFAVGGQPEGRGRLHQVLTLDTRDPILAGIFPDLPLVPLFYGFQYEEGMVKYKIVNAAAISITELDANSYSEFWPYEDYPRDFPVRPFTLTQPTECDVGTFEVDVWQHIDRQFAEHFIAIVPPSDAYGIDLWKKGNNFDFVHVKWFVEPLTREVVVYNECD